MNVWRRGPLLENPYYRTAFRVARLPPEVVQHRTLVQLIGQVRRLVAGDPRAHLIQGQPVTAAAINAAEAVLLDPPQRIVEELLEHATEHLPLERVRQVAEEVGETLAPPAGPLPVTNLAGLAPWGDALVRRFLAEAPGGQPSFGALELTLVPPCGRAEEE